MPVLIVRNDITKINADAIVNAANSSLLGGGGVDGAIHRAAGPELLNECRTLGGCKTGQAKITRGYNLPAKYVIHTVGPVWRGGGMGEAQQLRDCYRNSLALAEKYGCESVAFPLISSGAYGYPKEEAFIIANEEAGAFVKSRDITVFIVLFGRELFDIRKIDSDLAQYISGKEEISIKTSQLCFAEEAEALPFGERRMPQAGLPVPSFALNEQQEKKEKKTRSGIMRGMKSSARKTEATPLTDREQELQLFANGFSAEDAHDLVSSFNNLDENFQQMLFRIIDEKGLKDSDVYHDANIDKRHFSKIRCNSDYRPRKETVCALAFGLKLSVDETQRLLKAAGYTLNESLKFDVVIKYYLEHKKYDVINANNVLFSLDLPQMF